jgi:hypothetical protein
MSHYLTGEGIIAWPTKQAEEEAVDAVADELTDEEVPEGTDETGLTPEEAEIAMNKLVEVAEAINERVTAVGGGPDMELNKAAASVNIHDAAAYTAIRLMEKAAEETAVDAGPDIPGQSVPEPDLSATAEGELDAVTTPSSELVVPQGTTEVDTRPGAVGKEALQPAGQPGAQGSAPTGEVAKQANVLELLTAMARHQPKTLQKIAAADGASLSGGSTMGPAPTPRKDLDDNLLIPGAVASGKGQTRMEFPAAANIGVTKKQPGGTPGATAATPNNPAKDAYKQAAVALRQTEQGRIFLDAVAEEAAAEKAAAVSNALQALANLGR